VYISEPNIRENVIEVREYQVKIAKACTSASTLVVLPTALGKTVIAALVIARVFTPEKKVLFLAPTRPLVEQHTRELERFLTISKICMITGDISSEKRVTLWSDSQIIVSTPEAIYNDLIRERISLQGVNLIIFDEAHRAVGNHAYVDIASIYRNTLPKEKRLILGMTASPGSSQGRIREICTNLGIERIEYRTESDPDVSPYIPGFKIEWIPVDLHDATRRVISLFQKIYDDRVERLRSAGLLPAGEYVSLRDLMDVPSKMNEILKEKGDAKIRQYQIDWAVAMKINKAIEFAETQGRSVLLSYLERLISESPENKANQEIMADERFRDAFRGVESIPSEHPKVAKVIEILRSQLERAPDSRIIIFTQYRETCESLVETVKGVDGIRPARFIGQTNREDTAGMKQREQIATLVQFRRGEINLLVATSVGEEGLDIPETDLVVFYEPIPSEIRSIQRRGRTGRKRIGEVKVLYVQDTRDEWYLRAAMIKERRMKKELYEVKRSLEERFIEPFPEEIEAHIGASRATLPEIKPGVVPLDSFSSEGARVEVIVDHREFGSGVTHELYRSGVKIITASLDAGDYIVSDRVAIERKSTDDFQNSVMDGRIFMQAKALCNLYPVPIMIVEGEIFETGRVHDSAIAGAIVSLLADFRIPVIFSTSPKETARLIRAIAHAEQTPGRKPVLRYGKGKFTTSEWQRFVVEGLPLISAVIAERLLDRFGSVRAIANASKEELMQVEGIGEKRAEEIVRLMTAQWKKGDNKEITKDIYPGSDSEER